MPPPPNAPPPGNPPPSADVPAWVAVTVVAFAIWLTTIPGLTNGFVSNAPQAGQKGSLMIVPEIENVVAKTSWAIAYAVGAWRASARARARAHQPAPLIETV